MERIILFDGVCNLCNDSVQFIIKRDPNGHFKFASLQSEVGQKLLSPFGAEKEMNSFILIENDRIYMKSSAALRVCNKLSGFWILFSIFWVVPSFIRNFLYDIVAKNRYKWFGKKKAVCFQHQK